MTAVAIGFVDADDDDDDDDDEYDNDDDEDDGDAMCLTMVSPLSPLASVFCHSIDGITVCKALPNVPLRGCGTE